MPQPALWLITYDTPSATARTRLRRLSHAEASGHQRSVYETFPTPQRGSDLLDSLRQQKGSEDDLWVFAIDPRARRIALGTAVPAAPWQGCVVS